MYNINIDQSAKLVSVKLGGMMTVDEVHRYIADLAHEFLRARLRAGYLMMIDTTEATLQRQEVVDALKRQIIQFPKARRIAMVNGSSLARMQIKRVMTQPYALVFDTEAEGMAWLMSSEPDVAAA